MGTHTPPPSSHSSFLHELEKLHRQKGFVSNVSLLLHAFGLNVRHLGAVRERATGNSLIRQELLEEMLARTLPAAAFTCTAGGLYVASC